MPITTGTGTTPGNYMPMPVIARGSIAQNVYGDAQLWYIIADANSLGFGPNDPLPTTEIGRTYRIPSASARTTLDDVHALQLGVDHGGNSTPSVPAAASGSAVRSKPSSIDDRCLGRGLGRSFPLHSGCLSFWVP